MKNFSLENFFGVERADVSPAASQADGQRGGGAVALLLPWLPKRLLAPVEKKPQQGQSWDIATEGSLLGCSLHGANHECCKAASILSRLKQLQDILFSPACTDAILQCLLLALGFLAPARSQNTQCQGRSLWLLVVDVTLPIGAVSVTLGYFQDKHLSTG